MGLWGKIKTAFEKGPKQVVATREKIEEPKQTEPANAKILADLIVSNSREGIKRVHDELIEDTSQNFNMKREVAAKLLKHEGIKFPPRRIGQVLVMQAAYGFAELGMLDETRQSLDLLAQMGTSRDDMLQMIDTSSEKINDLSRYAQLDNVATLVAATMTLPKFVQQNENGNALDSQQRQDTVKARFGQGIAIIVDTMLQDEQMQQPRKRPDHSGEHKLAIA